MGTEFSNSLIRTFGVKGELAESIGSTLAGLFQATGIASAVTSVGKALGLSKGAATGAGLGAGAAVGVGALASSGALGFGGAQAFLSTVGGPVGIIAGLALGALAGGLLGSTKRGGATFDSSGVTGTWGNSQSRIDNSVQLGGNAVAALQQIADALGVTLGNVSGSISVRKDSLRYDPTGQGISKTSKGALDFGQDEAALLAAVFTDQVRKGAFDGLSQGFRDYLTSGDIESRLQDILTLKSVQDEAAQRRDPQAFELGELDKWRTSMLAIATATGEGMADIEFVYGERRKEILEAANDNSLQLERDRQGLLAQIADLEGRSVEALAITRQLEKDATDESLHSLLDRRNALIDEAAEVAELARKTEELATAARAAEEEMDRLQTAVMNELDGLEREWLQVTGQADALLALDLAAMLRLRPSFRQARPRPPRFWTISAMSPRWRAPPASPKPMPAAWRARPRSRSRSSTSRSMA